MTIQLKSIEEEGKDYSFNETSEEVFGAFKDLIGENPFKILLTIRPLGNTYHVSGSVSASYSDVCSDCGYDIEVPLLNKINEILVIEKKRPRNTAVSQSQKNFDSDGPAATYLNSSELDLNEFLHEMMASGQPMYPRCQDTQLCQSRQFHQDDDDEPVEKASGHPGFAALKDFKASKQ